MSELPVSVVIPAFNRAHLLGRAIESVRQQIDLEDEIIVVDDGSTDNTPEVVAAFRDSRIRYIHQSNAGAGAARNRGVSVATRPLIAFLDSDDEWLPGKLALQRRFMEARPEILFSFTDLGRERGGARQALLRGGLWHADMRDWDKILGPACRYSWYAGLPSAARDFNVYTGNLYPGLMYYGYCSIVCVMVRRAEASGTIRFTEGIATYEDWECLGRLARQGKAAFLDFIGSLQHQHEGARITDADWVQRAESRLTILHNVWGSNPEFLKKHGAAYRALVHEQELARLRGMIVLGRQREAREEMRKLAGVPIVYRSAAWFAAGLDERPGSAASHTERLVSRDGAMTGTLQHGPETQVLPAAQLAPSLRLVPAASVREYQVQWAALARSALASNVFYEPWMLLPALEYIRENENVQFLLIFGPPEHGIEPLWGFFPLEVQTRCLHLPMRTLAFWQHRYCYLTVPLVHAGHVDQVFDLFWRWFERNPLDCRVLDTNYFLGEGPFHAACADFLIGRCMLVLNEHPRGLQKHAGSFNAYVSALLSKKRYHALNRSRLHLESFGPLEYVELKSASSVAGWVEQFLRLEASGWKGTVQGGAIAKQASDADYFRAMTEEGWRQGRVTLLSLVLNGRPVAMKHLLRDGEGAFIFKIAYDESFAKHSPGVLLELDHLRSWQDSCEIRWVDTCAAPRHSVFNLISNERRIIRQSLVSNGSALGDLFVSALPLLRWLRHRLQPNRARPICE